MEVGRLRRGIWTLALLHSSSFVLQSCPLPLPLPVSPRGPPRPTLPLLGEKASSVVRIMAGGRKISLKVSGLVEAVQLVEKRRSVEARIDVKRMRLDLAVCSPPTTPANNRNDPSSRRLGATLSRSGRPQKMDLIHVASSQLINGPRGPTRETGRYLES